jgi:hypothetical protein
MAFLAGDCMLESSELGLDRVCTHADQIDTHVGIVLGVERIKQVIKSNAEPLDERRDVGLDVDSAR